MTCGGPITYEGLRTTLALARRFLRESECIADAIESKSSLLRAEVRREPDYFTAASRLPEWQWSCLMWDFSTRHDRLLDARTVTILHAVRYSRLGEGLKGFSTKELAAKLGLPPALSVEDALQFAQEAAREAASEASRDEDDDRYLDESGWFRPPLPATKRLRRRIANYGLLDTLILATLTLPPLAALLVWLAS